MTVRSHAARTAPEFALVVALAACLTTVVLQGFVVAPALQFNVALVAGVSCACQLVLYAGAYRRANAPWAAAGYLLLGAVVVGAGMATSTAPDPLADVEGSHLAFCAVLVVVNLLVFALSRTGGALVALVAAGLGACAFVQYVYHADLVAPTLGFAACTAALWVVRAYARSMAAASEPGKSAFGAAALTAVLCAAAALVLSALVYALVVAPLNPGHLTVKLFTEYRSLETVEVRNPSEVVVAEDPDAATVTLTDEVIYGSIPVQLDASDPALAELGDFVQDAREQSGTKNLFKLEMVDEGGVYLYTYELPRFWWLLLIAAPFVLAALAMAVRMILRARCRARMRALDSRAQVGALYGRLVRAFGVLGLGKAPDQTPCEYAAASAERLEPFAQDGFGWVQLTALYERCHYGAQVPAPDELAACWRVYDGHFKRARRLRGRMAYFFRYFWLL